MRPDPRPVPGLAEALPELQSRLEKDASPRNLVLVAEAFWLAGHPELALEALDPAIARNEGGVAIRLLAGWCYEDLGLPRDAEAAFEAVRKTDPANPYAAGDPHAVTERAAEPERALSPEELSEVPPGPLYSATLAEIFEKQGFEGKALEIYREIVRLHPERDDLHQRIDELTQTDEGREESA